MVRTIVSITEQDKEWLDRYSHKQHQSTAETIRLAIRFFRKQTRSKFQESALEKTSGLWKKRKIDGLGYVQNLRQEWDS